MVNVVPFLDYKYDDMIELVRRKREIFPFFGHF
jgi:hypothetical protein